MAEKNINTDWTKDMIEQGFAMDVGKCIEMDMDADFGDDETMGMKVQVCRISENELRMEGKMDFGEDEEPTKFNSRYRRDIDMEEK